MAYSGDLLKIGNTALPGLREYKMTYAKLWANAERNMNGTVSASLIGIFPKIELSFRAGLTEDQVSSICALLDQPYFSVTFFNPKTKGTSTAQYYSSDYTVEILDRSRGLYKEFKVSLVPVSKAV